MADQNTIQSIIDYYTNLLIIQYNQQPKAAATISLLIEQLESSGVVFDVRDGYDIETAIGVQLDVLAKYIGIDRFFTKQDLTGFFSFATYDTDPIYGIDDLIGYADYSNVGTKTGKWLTYDDVLSQTFALNDSDFRTLMKLRILQNNCNHSAKEINDGLFEIFGINLWMVDNLDMSLTYYCSDSIVTLMAIALEKGILPKPMGVSITLQTVIFVTTDGGDIITTDAGDPLYL